MTNNYTKKKNSREEILRILKFGKNMVIFPLKKLNKLFLK